MVPEAKAIVWEHNTHVGDARATDMASSGEVNIGEPRASGMGSRTSRSWASARTMAGVIAARAWEAPMQEMRVPDALAGSLEDMLHDDRADKLLVFRGVAGVGNLALDRDPFMHAAVGSAGAGPQGLLPLPHRAIGVVYHAARERGNDVPTILPLRHDAFIHVDETRAVRPLPVPVAREQTPETFPGGLTGSDRPHPKPPPATRARKFKVDNRITSGMPRLSFLIVDDDPLMLAMLEPKLRDARFGDTSGVRSFTRPDEALAFLAQSPEAPHVVLSDFNLKANLSGLDLLGRVARSHPDSIRILMSGYSSEQIGIKPDAPIHGFVEKELRADDIIRNILSVAESASGSAGQVPRGASRPSPEAVKPATRQAFPAPAAATPSAPAARQSDTTPLDLFQRFVQATEDFAVVALDVDGTVRSWNPGAERIKGWKAKEIVGRHFSAFYPPADLAAHKPQYVLQRASMDGRFEDEGWRIRKDGTMFWANAVVTAIRDRDGQLLGFVKVTRDLTARRHAEDAVRQSEERYRLFIESVKDYAMFILDPTGHVMTWNEGAQRLKGYRPEEIVGNHFSVFYSKEDRDRHHPEEELTLALRDGRYEEEGWRIRKDGTRFWANVTLTALYDSDRRHVGFAKVTRDLTERKRAEEGLRSRADSYAELNRELDAFSHSVAHDLRAPVRAIHTLSERVLEEAGQKLGQDQIQSLRAISSSSFQMGLLIQDLLDLSLTTRQEPHREDVDLSHLAAAIVEEKRAIYPERVVHAQIEPGVRAHADPRLVRVALSNLLDNAVKFARGTEAFVEFGREPDAQGGAYYVRDQGVGFPSEQAHRLFQPFSRLHAGSDFPGTGIGLTIVERIVRRHGGAVRAESHEGIGTTFFFMLGETPRTETSVKTVRKAR